jgi:hypothetical protein
MRCQNASFAAQGTYPNGKSRIVGVSLAVIGFAATAASAVTFPKTETFGSGPGNFTTQARNGVGGNNIAFSNTDNTGTGGGSSGAGEIGGSFARTLETEPAYVADTTIGTLTRADNLNMSGHFIVTADNGFDGAFLLGYVNTSSDSPFGGNGDVGVTGIGILDGSPLRANLYAKGTAIATTQSGILLNTPYTFSVTYDPVTFTMSGSIGPLNFGPVQTGLDPGDTFNGFGFVAGSAGSNVPNLTVNAFFDDLTYSVVPEPASAALLVLSGFAVLIRRRAALPA